MKKLSTLLLGLGVASFSFGQINSFPVTTDFESDPTGPTGCGPSYNFSNLIWENGDDATPASPTHFVDFTVDVGGTSSSGTGPSVDHTLGTNAGHYIYAETSCSGTGYTNSEFSIVSNNLDFSGVSGMSFSYWYHSLGGTQGNIFIDVDTDGANSWVLDVAGGAVTDNIDLWQNAVVDLSTFTGPGFNNVRVRIRYISGTSFTGDVGLDDLTFAEPLAFDLSYNALDNPGTSCSVGAAVLTGNIIQTGGSPIPMGDTIFVDYSDGTTTIMDTNVLAAPLNPGDTLFHTYSVPADYSIPGTYNIVVNASYIGDPALGNDTLYTATTSIATVSTFPYLETFATGQNSWNAGGNNSSWFFGTPTGAIIDTSASDINSWKTGGAGGTYNAGEDSYVQGPCFDFTNAVGDEWVAMSVFWESEISWDGANLQSSNDGGATWDLVGNFGDPNNWYTDNTINGNPGGNGEGWTGRDNTGNGSGGWVTAKLPLDSAVYGQPNVLFRVYFGSDGSVQDEGFAFDDFAIASPFTYDNFADTVLLCSKDTSWIGDAGMGAWSEIEWSTGTIGQMDTLVKDTIDHEYVVMVTDSFGLCASDTFTLRFVNFIAPDLGADQTVCIGDVVAYDAGTDTCTAYTYVWNDASTAQVYTTSTVGTVWVTKTDSTGLCWASDSASIANYGQVWAGMDTSVCDGATATFTASLPMGASYAWSSGDLTISTDVSVAGDYVVTGTDSAGCVTMDTVALTLFANPVADAGADQQACSGAADVTFDAGAGFSAYLWSPGGATTQTIDVDPAAFGIGTHDFIVEVTDANGCTDVDTVVLTVDCTIGISELDGKLSVNAYPNPTQGMISIDVQDVNASNLNLIVTDLQGRVVMNKMIGASNSNYTVQLDLTGLAKGAYNMQFFNGTNAVNSRLIIQ